MNSKEKHTIPPELPNIIGLSHICIFVDDMEQAVAYYRDLLGVPTGKMRAFLRREALWMRRPMGMYPLRL